MIFLAAANDSNLFACLGIIGVFNFRTDTRIRKYFYTKISYTKIFRRLNFRIYGILQAVHLPNFASRTFTGFCELASIREICFQ